MLDVRTVLRKAAQYWLASAVVAALAGIPFALLLGLLYGAREQPLAGFLRGLRLLEVLALLVFAVVVWRLRRHVMLAVDRLFFREPTTRADPRRPRPERQDVGLDRGARPCGDGAGRAIAPPDLDRCPGDDAARRKPRAGGIRAAPAPASSLLAAKLLTHGKPWTVDLARASGPFRDLPEEDRIWLGDAGAAVLVPLIGSAGELDGVLALGPKRSELPYSRQDHLLLEAVGGVTGIWFESRRLRGSRAARDVRADESRATECVTCGRVAGSDAQSCPECGHAMRAAALPEQLFGKFRLERRIGEGGMGIVYGATDLTLGRRVALKTLPRTSPEDADRLRREARAMASITHPNLALILGAESWQGTPVLVLELLAGGTLETRIAGGPLPPREAFEMAYRMALVLERLHASGLLHRDVKPSNVGFSEEDEPKLLDFGLVEILRDVVPRRPLSVDVSIEESGFAGTPLYMSPEALEERRPEPGFDLWGLAVVAFEAVTGRHPFERDTTAATLAAIRRGWTDELRDRLPSGAGAANAFFETALSAERRRRFGTASDLAERLLETASSLS